MAILVGAKKQVMRRKHHPQARQLAHKTSDLARFDF